MSKSFIQIRYERLKKKKRRNIILNIVCLLIAGSGLAWTANYFWRYISYEITNDAFVDQYIAPVNVRVSGYVQEVRFREHQYVHQGDTLVILDNREYLIRQKEAQAALLDAKGAGQVLASGIRTSQTRIDEQDANLAEAKAKLWQAEQDYRRYERLLQEESVPRQQYEQMKATYEAAKARYDALRKQKEAAHSQYDETTHKKVGVEANVLRAEAALDLANLNLSYTVVTAPYSGYMGRRTLEPVSMSLPDRPCLIWSASPASGSPPITAKPRLPISTSVSPSVSRWTAFPARCSAGMSPPYPRLRAPSILWCRPIIRPVTL